MLMTDDFFRNRLDQLIDLRHPLAVLANRMPWQEIEASLAHRFARQVRCKSSETTYKNSREALNNPRKSES